MSTRNSTANLSSQSTTVFKSRADITGMGHRALITVVEHGSTTGRCRKAEASRINKNEKATKFEFDESDGTWRTESVWVCIEDEVFAEGRFKKCHRMLMKKDGSEESKSMALKMPSGEEDPESLFASALSQVVASDFAAHFNKLCCSRPVSFVRSCVLKLHERGDSFALAEPFMQGNFRKHNAKDGSISSGEAIAQAITHFMWEASGQRIFVGGVAGVEERYTNAAVLGEGEAGPAARRFLSAHRCNFLCRVHSLLPAPQALAVLPFNLPSSPLPSPSRRRNRLASPRNFSRAVQQALALAAALPPPH